MQVKIYPNPTEYIYQRFTTQLPLFLCGDKLSLKLEIKPYLQPFEEILAMRELRAIVEDGLEIDEQFGLHIANTDIPAHVLKSKLTYWQRIGTENLQPTLQATMEFTQNGAASFERKELHNARRLRYGPHDLHEYRGKFFPQLVRSLMNISKVGDNALILDPMCGSGTTPCEAVALGHTTIAADLNPLSVLIATVKSRVVAQDADRFLRKIKKDLNLFDFSRSQNTSSVWNSEDDEYLSKWFNRKALDEIGAIILQIREVRDTLYKDFYTVCLSNIVRTVSWQKKDDLRVRKEVVSYVEGTAINSFLNEVIQQTDRIYHYLKVFSTQPSSPSVDIRHGNAVHIAELFPEKKEKVDLLITSPPYATALPYLDTDRLSLIALGLLPRKMHRGLEEHMVGTREVSERQRLLAWSAYQQRRDELPDCINKLIEHIAQHNHKDGVGFRRRNLPALLGKYYLNMLDAMRSAFTMMASNTHAYYVVGNNSTNVNGDRIEIPTDTFLFELGGRAGWKMMEMLPMELLVSRDIFRDNRGTAETILCFRKT
jgi:hypothetical protein